MPITRRKALLQAIAGTIADYRAGDIPTPTYEHVDRWVRQFDKEVQEDLLAEMNHVLERVYFSRQKCLRTLEKLIVTERVAGPTPKRFWKSANFLRIQTKGESQRAMLSLFDKALFKVTGLRVADCGSRDGPFVYLDDCIFTATHVRWDLIHWAEGEAPKKAEVLVLALVLHRGNTDYTAERIRNAGTRYGKKIGVRWERALRISDCEGSNTETEVCLPKVFPKKDPHVKCLLLHLEQAGHPPAPRTVMTSDVNKVFSSEVARHIVEQQFLKAGARIKFELCPNLKENHWPLGYHVFKSVGFGSLVVTYRNCPNNCPLALWANDPWKPLFPRKPNPREENQVPED